MIKNKVASVRRWTKAAADCYFRGCTCKGCFYDWFFASTRAVCPDLDSSYKCQMKPTVLVLVRALGQPERENLQEYLSSYCDNCVYLKKCNCNTFFCRIKATFVNPKRQHKCKTKRISE